MKYFSIPLAVMLWFTRHGGRCLSALAGVFAKQKLQCILTAWTLLVCTCAGGPVNVPEGLSPAEIIQRAQEASDRNRYNVALQYYQALRERNPGNDEMICTAEYEIAFIHYKQKDYALAKNEFNALLERYEAPGGYNLPQEFKILANIVLKRIEEKENVRPFGKKRKEGIEETQRVAEQA
jgi:tetratricopeptide (TPR) repeat protein